MVLIPSFLNSATSRLHPASSAIGSLFAEEPPIFVSEMVSCVKVGMQFYGCVLLHITIAGEGWRDKLHTWLVVDTANVEASLAGEESCSQELAHRTPKCLPGIKRTIALDRDRRCVGIADCRPLLHSSRSSNDRRDKRTSSHENGGALHDG